mmetsp:Transcript_3972/g.10502  ORF Transcript_3972/g.10502 Transcript_3972/m.10502 type:complete len:84 (+) Transcript_3972:88-339(+)
MSDIDWKFGVLSAIGTYFASKAVIHFFKTFLRPARDLKKFGKWAVITGATGELRGRRKQKINHSRCTRIDAPCRLLCFRSASR